MLWVRFGLIQNRKEKFKPIDADTPLYQYMTVRPLGSVAIAVASYIRSPSSETEDCWQRCATNTDIYIYIYILSNIHDRGDINKGTWPSRLGESRIWDIKYGHDSRGTRTWEWLRWRGPVAIINDRSILSSDRMLHKDYNRKRSVEKKNTGRGS
jgi:hypothetical protein